MGLFSVFLGALAHGVGMYRKHRREDATRAAWEIVLYWICWIVLFALLVALAIRSNYANSQSNSHRHGTRRNRRSRIHRLRTRVLGLADAGATFMNALFHGLDFRKLQSGPLFSLVFSFALAVAVVWAFVLGALYGWCLRFFGREPESGLKPCRNAERRWFRRAECIICSPGIASFFQVFAR